MSDTTITPDTIETEPTPNDRRAMLRKLAIGGAGAAAGVVLLSNGNASAAAEPGALELGTAATNTSTTPTSLVHTPGAARITGASTLSVGSAVPGPTTVFPANVGGYGNSLVANGLHGSTDQPAGFGVVAANLTPMAPSAVTGPTPGLHLAGELYSDADGTLWFTVPVPPPAVAGTVRFVKLAGTPASGAFHAIDPQRVYDSRQANYTVKGAMAPNSFRVISVADGRSANGTVTMANAVPAGATAVHINLTAASMTGPNFLSVTAGDKTATTTSLLNWSAGATQVANSITVPVDATRQIKVFCGDQTGSTDVVVDVFGYHL